MRFKLLILILAVISSAFCLEANAGMLTVQNFASPIKIANKLSQTICVNFVSNGNWKLYVQALDNRVINQNYPQYSIPISRIELAESGGNPITNFDCGKIIDIKSGQNMGTTNFVLALNALTTDSDRPGNYTADIKFTLLNNNAVVAEEVFCFRFRQDEISSIDFSQKVVSLNLDKEKSLQKNCSQNIQTPLGVYVKSNKDWKLYIRRISDLKDSNINYCLRVLSSDSTIDVNQSQEYIPIRNVPIFIASGKSTINPIMNCLDKKLINIDYQIRGPQQDIIPVGNYSEDFEYRLETED